MGRAIIRHGEQQPHDCGAAADAVEPVAQAHRVEQPLEAGGGKAEKRLGDQIAKEKDRRADAAPGTIRALHGDSIEANSVHGSDSAETAATEIAFFFSEDEIVG